MAVMYAKRKAKELVQFLRGTPVIDEPSDLPAQPHAPPSATAFDAVTQCDQPIFDEMTVDGMQSMCRRWGIACNSLRTRDKLIERLSAEAAQRNQAVSGLPRYQRW